MFRRDTRAISSAITHVLAIAIVTVLISGLVVSASGALENEQERAAKQELRTIGDRIAAGITSLDSVAETGSAVSLELRLSRRVGGESYTVSLDTGSVCSDVAVNPDACLSLRAASSDDAVVVPVMNRSPVSLEERAPGQFLLSVEPGTGDAPPRDRRTSVKVAPNIGIGSDVTRSVVAQEPAEQPRPIAGFAFEPTAPVPGESVAFDATVSEGLGTTLSDYDWTFDGGAPSSGVSVSHTFATPGVHTANLTVSDEDGRSDSIEKPVKVTGLVYNGDATTTDLDADGTDAGVELSFTNDFGDSVSVKQIQVNTSDDVDVLTDGLFEPAPEGVEVYATASGRDRQLDYGGGKSIPRAGVIVDLEAREDDDSEGSLRVDTGDDLTLYFNEFADGGGDVDMSGETVVITVRYEHDGTNFITRVEVTP
ncbi:PKD domain containing protein [Haloferax mucosum ATCC BAA-1512]|uniref:PKD domain containing protein n=1 Tax=Haloferax mucosum ATCC BAA-1512 TaxID=662479 RepID=M0I3S5_9EURY|nr:PKD domain-containing protein [Haloferax mucosum]ELZ91411.1 PKD domain containing protein [Haloferax mucosum ATCC BAA-1512]